MRIVSNAAILWAVRIATLTSSAILSVLTSRILGVAGRGVYVFPAIDASVSTTFAAGLSSTAAYFLLNRRVGPSFAKAAVIVLLIFIVAGVGATYATAAITHSMWAILPAAIFVVAYAVYSLAYGFLLGIDRARSAGLLNAAAYITTLALVSTALIVGRGSAQLAIAAWVLGTAIVGLAGFVLVLRRARDLVGDNVDAKDLLHFAVRAGLVNLANLLNYRVDIYIVAILAPISVVGLYTLAVTGAESALSLTQAISQATLPRIGSLERSDAGVFTARCLRNGIFLAAILAICGMVFASSVVGLILGPAYASIVAPFRVLLVGLVAASTSSMISNYFMVNRGETRVPIMTSLISTLLCAAISVILVPRVGMIGAALGSTVAYIVSQAIAIRCFCGTARISWLRTVLIDRQDLLFYARLVRRFAPR